MAGDNNVNGNYGVQQPYGQSENYNTMQAGTPSAEPASSMPTSGAPATDAEQKNPSKEEIGWFFVEQYYKTLCNEPSKLYLYYTKRSQFVSGDEAEKVLVAVGQKAISERIKELDIQDCKVRVLNVDSQESLKNILVQVIGEISNKAEPHRKFVQTFVLAEQPSGYYVLNDIFRYIAWEEEEYDNGVEGNDEPNQTSTALKPDTTTLTTSGDPAPQNADAEMVDRKLEEDILQNPSAREDIPKNVETNGHVDPEAPEIHAENIPEGESKEAEVEALSLAVAATEEIEQEKPGDSDPTPVASPPQPTKPALAPTQTFVAPTKPAAPKTWASLVGRAAAPLTPIEATPAAATKPSQHKPKVIPSSAKPSMNAPITNDEGSSTQVQAPMNGNSEWQLADNKQRQNRPHSQSVSSSHANILGYVKNVTEKVDASLLKAHLQSFGELNYFDVSRLKNCAFIEYADISAYNAAVAANPHTIGGEQIFVEERRPRGNAYGGNAAQRGGSRGGRGGNENFRGNNQGRGGFNKDGNRGGFNNRGGRGGPMAPKARGQPQAA